MDRVAAGVLKRAASPLSTLEEMGFAVTLVQSHYDDGCSITDSALQSGARGQTHREPMLPPVHSPVASSRPAPARPASSRCASMPG